MHLYNTIEERDLVQSLFRNQQISGLDFLHNYPEQARQMGANGKPYVQAKYGWDRVLAKHE